MEFVQLFDRIKETAERLRKWKLYD